jgi:putative endonuclease
VVKGFTNTYGVKMLVYYEQHATATAAIQREKNIKHWSRKWKIDLIRSLNPDWRDLWGTLRADMARPFVPTVSMDHRVKPGGDEVGVLSFRHCRASPGNPC